MANSYQVAYTLCTCVCWSWNSEAYVPIKSNGEDSK